MKVDRAKTRIILDHPFFASILLRRPMKFTKNVPTLAVDATATIYINPDFIEQWSPDQVMWGLCHEIGHVMAMHAVRRGSRNPKRWNIAGDAWINDMLKECKIGEPIPNCVDMPGSYKKFTEQIYEEMMKESGEGGEGRDGQDGIGDDVIYGVGDEDGNQKGPLTEGEIREIEAEVKIMIAQAAQAAKMQGKLPGMLADIVAESLESKVPWYEHLEKYATSKMRSRWDWTVPNRRYISQGIILPSRPQKPTIGTVVIQSDISGSVSKREFDHFAGHALRIMEECNPKKVYVLYTDTQVQRCDEFDQDEKPVLSFYSGGGTDMTAGFEYIKEHGIEPDVVITLTDGYTPYPENPEFDAVWCVSTDAEVPSNAGEVVRFEVME